MAGVLKKSTLLKGLNVSKNPHAHLTPLYKRILKVLTNFPKDYAYRKETEKIVNDRLKIMNENIDIPTIEQKIGCGQIEEVIIQARNELNLVENMLMWKPWEKLVQEAPPNQWTWPPHK